MEAPFDIFRTEPNGAVCWLEAVQDLATAKAHIQAIARPSGSYVVLNQRTHARIRVEVKPDGDLTTCPG